VFGPRISSIVSQSSPEETAAQAHRLGLSRLPEVDADLDLSARLDPAAVPAVSRRARGRVHPIQDRTDDEIRAIARDALTGLLGALDSGGGAADGGARPA
jgi:hypothetical protein